MRKPFLPRSPYVCAPAVALLVAVACTGCQATTNSAVVVNSDGGARVSYSLAFDSSATAAIDRDPSLERRIVSTVQSRTKSAPSESRHHGSLVFSTKSETVSPSGLSAVAGVSGLQTLATSALSDGVTANVGLVRPADLATAIEGETDASIRSAMLAGTKVSVMVSGPGSSKLLSGSASGWSFESSGARVEASGPIDALGTASLVVHFNKGSRSGNVLVEAGLAVAAVFIFLGIWHFRRKYSFSD